MEQRVVPSPPPELGGYRLHRLVAVTVFSDVWLAEDLALGRAVAVKAFTPKAGEDGIIPPFPVEEWRRRFLQEARLQAGLDHPHIVPVVGLRDAADGRPCILMQYLSHCLHDEVGPDPGSGESGEGRTVSPGRARDVLLQVLSALMEMHRRGIVHRDLKPRNLLLAGGPGGRVKITDFGMARPPGEESLGGSEWFGTRQYISPEQFAGAGRATARSDIFSLGVIGIRMLTGHLPDRERLAAVEDLPPAFARMLVRCLERDPASRPDAAGMLAELAAISLP